MCWRQPRLFKHIISTHIISVYTTALDLRENPDVIPVEDRPPQVRTKLAFDESGSLLVRWLLDPDFVPDRTTVTVETDGVGVKTHDVLGPSSWTRLNGLEPCAFHTFYVTFQSLDGFVLRTNSSEINSFTMPDQPQPPFVQRDGSTLFVWWTNSNQTFNIKSHKLFVIDAMNRTRIFEVQYPRNSELLGILKEDAVYRVNLRAVNEEGESKSSATVQTS
ncbi:uncharacterized protein DEA37_0000747 [Paragonimus westermani]|uniref:Fibronectin type-III domain-containing protein n=1 Tax=Paragonimus westermani TaxID=34504 RepID=A0A5J4NXM0_9TREM|nr:uncharacterized protein DEA37_0000747 [Paragonimus westermani]